MMLLSLEMLFTVSRSGSPQSRYLSGDPWKLLLCNQCHSLLRVVGKGNHCSRVFVKEGEDSQGVNECVMDLRLVSPTCPTPMPQS